MSEKEGLDILGIQPITKAVEKATCATVDGIAAVLSRICLPAAEEYGLWFRDRVHHWRTQNLAKIVQATERKLAESGAAPGVHAHPRLVGAILSEGSWIDDSEVQEMWAGLLSSSCSESGDDDSNLLFVDLLSGMTKMQAKILRYACERAQKEAGANGLVRCPGDFETGANEGEACLAPTMAMLVGAGHVRPNTYKIAGTSY